MGRTLAVLFLALIPSTAAIAAERALVLTDQEQTALVEILDAATKQGGISIAGKTTYFLNKLNAAPTVTSQTPIEPKEKPKPPEKPKDETHE
jgi:hypothetical protein